MKKSLAVGCWLVVGGLCFGAPEPGRALIDEHWENGWSAWAVSNLNDVVTLRMTNGVLRASNDRGPETKDQTHFTICSRLVKVEPGQEFVAVMESRGNLSQLVTTTLFRAKENQLRSFLPATAVLWYTADRQPLLAQDPTGVMLPTGSCFPFKAMDDEFVRTLHFGTVPKGAAYAALQIGGQFPKFTPGKWLELKRLALKVREGKDGDWDFGDVAAPRVERVSASPDKDPNAPIVFTVKDASPIVKLEVKLDGVDVTEQVGGWRWKVEERNASKSIVQPSTSNLQPVFTVSHEPWEDESIHLLDVVATDAAGNIARETLAQFCGEPPVGAVYSVRDDGMMLKDGEPFFPIGTYGARLVPENNYDADAMFAEFAANGLNLAGSPYTYRVGEKCLYDNAVNDIFWEKAEMQLYHLAARRHGISLWAWPTSHFYNYGNWGRAGRHAGRSDAQECADSLRYYRDCPEMMITYIGDDTASRVTAPEVRRRHNILHAIDPNRLTMQADANDYADRYLPFADATDIFAQEIYPFRNPEHEAHGLGQVIKDCGFAFDGLKKSGAKNRSVWTIPQAFSGDGLWHKYPTREIMRAQTFLAVIHGCRGVIYYNYWASARENSWGKTAERKADLYAVTRDLAAIAKDLTSRDAKEQPRAEIVEGAKTDPCGYTSVSCLLKEGEDGKGRLLLTASSLVYGSVKAKIRIGGLGVETLFENGRKVDFKDGVLTDSFGPGEVHVYRLGKGE